MIFGSVCSGIEAASVAWKPLGWRAAFVSEIEAFPRAVLQHRHPETPLHGDFTTIQNGDYEPIDLLVGGTPCQSFSVAGLRGGLDDDRGNLALEYLKLADRLRPRWLVWENVPGVLSSNGGRDFGSILGGMGELGYGVAYRVLDAVYFGVPQRRRRVFVVGRLGDWRAAAAVLFERSSLSHDPAPGYQDGALAAATISTRVADGSLDIFDQLAMFERLGLAPRRFTPLEVERLLGFPDEYTAIPESVLREVRRGKAAGRVSSSAKRPNGSPLLLQTLRERGAEGVSPEERSATSQTGVESSQPLRADAGAGGADARKPGEPLCDLSPADGADVHRPLPHDGEGQGPALSPLQHQAPSHRGRALRDFGKGIPEPVVADGPRYKALGNSMAVPCMAWIGRRIEAVEALSDARAAA